MVTSAISRMGRSPEEGIKAPVKTSTTTNITLSGTGQTLNGVVTGTGDRVLVKDQTNPAENGTYKVGPDAWERTTDMNAADDLANGQLIVDSNTEVLYSITYTGAWTPDITALVFTVLVGAMPSQIILTNSDPIDLVDHNVALITGALDPSVSQHLEFDFQAIQSKADDTTAAPLFLNPLGSYVQSPQTISGDPGLEVTGITINGVVYQASDKISDLGGTNIAQMILHRHSTTLPPFFVTSLSKTDDETHAIVTDTDVLFGLVVTGYDGGDYAVAAEIQCVVDGTPGIDDMPGRWNFRTTPVGSDSPVTRVTIGPTGLLEALFGFDVTGSIVVSGTVDGRDIDADGTAQDTHIADGTIHFTQAAISITASQVSDFAAAVAATPPAAHTHVAADVTDFQAAVSANASVAANTAKATNVPTALSIGTHTIAVLNITSDGGADDVTLPSFTATLSGVIPGSGGGTVNFMRADGTWATPPGTGLPSLSVVTEATTSRTAVAFEAIMVDDDTAGSTVTIDLPAGTANDQILVNKRGSTANVIIDGDSGETINGATTYTLTTQYESVWLMWTGTEWSIN